MQSKLNILNIRNRIGLSQERFARLIDVSFATINRWENDQGKPRGMVLDLLIYMDAVLDSGEQPEKIIEAAKEGPARLLMWLIRKADRPVRKIK